MFSSSHLTSSSSLRAMSHQVTLSPCCQSDRTNTNHLLYHSALLLVKFEGSGWSRVCYRSPGSVHPYHHQQPASCTVVHGLQQSTQWVVQCTPGSFRNPTVSVVGGLTKNFMYYVSGQCQKKFVGRDVTLSLTLPSPVTDCHTGPYPLHP